LKSPKMAALKEREQLKEDLDFKARGRKANFDRD
jgi:hypothetical protein